MAKKLTKATLNALRWFAQHEPVSLFPFDGPSTVIRRRIEKAGLTERCGVEPGRYGFLRFRLSPAGRAALASQHQNKP